jgi:peptidoglycan/LPS O-acetylase OafA/YrhL
VFGRPLSPLLTEAIFFSAIGAVVLSLGWRTRLAPLLRTIGLATYPLYLIHDTFGTLILRYVLDLGAGRYEALSVAIAACVGASLAIAPVLEPPLQTVVKRVFDQYYQLSGALMQPR